jgi:hypothetical protein
MIKSILSHKAVILKGKCIKFDDGQQPAGARISTDQRERNGKYRSASVPLATTSRKSTLLSKHYQASNKDAASVRPGRRDA